MLLDWQLGKQVSAIFANSVLNIAQWSLNSQTQASFHSAQISDSSTADLQFQGQGQTENSLTDFSSQNLFSLRCQWCPTAFITSVLSDSPRQRQLPLWFARRDWKEMQIEWSLQQRSSLLLCTVYWWDHLEGQEDTAGVPGYTCAGTRMSLLYTNLALLHQSACAIKRKILLVGNPCQSSMASVIDRGLLDKDFWSTR